MLSLCISFKEQRQLDMTDCKTDFENLIDHGGDLKGYPQKAHLLALTCNAMWSTPKLKRIVVLGFMASVTWNLGVSW